MTGHASETLAVFSALAETIAAAAPRDWRKAVLRGYATGDGCSGHRGVWYDTAVRAGRGREEIDPNPALRRVYELESGADFSVVEFLIIELVVHTTGRFEALTGRSLRRTADRNGLVYLLRPNDTPAEPDAFVPGPAEPRQASDPREAVHLLGECLRRRAAILGRGETLPAPLAPARRADLERVLGVPLPDDLRALYGMIDGDGGAGLYDQHKWVGLSELVKLSRTENRWWVRRGWESVLSRPVLFDADPAGAVSRALDRPGWIPFATGDDILSVDMDPGPNGIPGQVIRVGRHHGEGPIHVADSVTSLLRRHVAALGRGDYHHENGRLSVDLGIAHELTRSRAEPCILKVDGVAIDLRIRPQTQRLVVANAYQVDLDRVRDAPSLREVELTNCPTADLTPLCHAPVEALTLGLDTIDLTPLAGHPTLRTLTLATGDPVDLRPLRDCPRLYGLDLSRAAVPDLTVLEEMDGLLYLNLREEQWRQTPGPATLAAAGLAGHPSLRAAAGWARTLAGDAAGVQYSKGRFTPPGGARTPVWRRAIQGPARRW